MFDQMLTSADFTSAAPANDPDLAFGQAVAVAGNWMAVGAPSDNDGIDIYEAGGLLTVIVGEPLYNAANNGTTDDGLVSIRGRNIGGTNAWGQVGLPKSGQPGSAFGTSVDLHGEYLIVGAPLNENGSAVRTGAAHVYRPSLLPADKQAERR